MFKTNRECGAIADSGTSQTRFQRRAETGANGNIQNGTCESSAVVGVMLHIAVEPHHQGGHRGFWKWRNWPASQTPPLPPAAQTNIAPHAFRKNIGKNTMQMHRVETKAGRAISCERADEDRVLKLFAPPPYAGFTDIFDGHSRVIHQDPHRQRKSAERYHQVDGFDPAALKTVWNKAPRAEWTAR